MTSKKKPIFNIAIIFLFAVLIAGVMYLMPTPAFASAAKDSHHGSEETEANVDEAGGQKEDHAVQGHVEQPAHESEAHEEKETHGKVSTHQTEGDGEAATHGGGHEETAHGGGHEEEEATHGDGGHGEEAVHGGGHGEVTAHGDGGGHGEEAAHGEEGEHGGGHGAESWWRFTGWQVVFAAIGCLYFALVLAWLPLLVAKKGYGGAH